MLHDVVLMWIWFIMIVSPIPSVYIEGSSNAEHFAKSLGFAERLSHKLRLCDTAAFARQVNLLYSSILCNIIALCLLWIREGRRWPTLMWPTLTWPKLTDLTDSQLTDFVLIASDWLFVASDRQEMSFGQIREHRSVSFRWEYME